MWYQLFKYSLFTPYTRAVVRPWIVGADNVPATGGALLAGNHLSAGETFMLPASIKRQLTFPAKAELFTGDHGPASKVVAWFLKSVGQVPMDRRGGRASAEGLQPVLDALAEGRLVGIFPEGTRSPDGRLYKGHTGVARLALASGVPVVPVGMVGTEIVRNRLGIPGFDKPGFIIGEPLDFSAYKGATDQRTLRWATDQVMLAIQNLTGQEYVDAYAARVKGGDLAGQDLDKYLGKRPGEGLAVPVPMAERAA